MVLLSTHRTKCQLQIQPQIKSLLIHRTVGTTLTYLNCHAYIMFVVAICLQPAVSQLLLVITTYLITHDGSAPMQNEQAAYYYGLQAEMCICFRQHASMSGCYRTRGMSSKLVRPNFTLRTMQLSVWVVNNFMNIEIVFLTTLFIMQLWHNRIPCGHSKKWNAWAADNFTPLHIPFLSIIA